MPSRYHGTGVCHLRKLACTEHCAAGGTVAHMQDPLQVSWHRGVRFLAVSTPSPWRADFETLGGPWGGTIRTKTSDF